VASIAGLIVVIAGLAMVILQILTQTRRQRIDQTTVIDQPRSLVAKAGPVEFNLRTTFPGLVVLAFGVLLLVVAVVAGK
jgi:hypothetical protein